jgi:hypothetical protein
MLVESMKVVVRESYVLMMNYCFALAASKELLIKNLGFLNPPTLIMKMVFAGISIKVCPITYLYVALT